MVTVPAYSYDYSQPIDTQSAPPPDQVASPAIEKFERFGFPREAINVRQILGRPGEVWLPESGTEHISVIRTA